MKILVFLLSFLVFYINLVNSTNLFSFGGNTYGELGTGNTQSKLGPTKVLVGNDTTTKKPIVVLTVGCGRDHSVFYGSDKKLYSFGRNDRGQLGVGTRGNPELTAKAIDLTLKEGVTIKKVEVGIEHFTVVLTSDSKMYSFGWDTYGFLGKGTNGATNLYQLTPTPVIISNLQNAPIKDLSCGYEHCVVLSDGGKVYAWGRNTNGEVGDGTTSIRSQPTFVTFPNNMVVTAISTFGRHTLAIGSNEKVYSWGFNDFGQLGNGGTNSSTTPKPVKINSVLEFKLIKQVAAGFRHSVLYDNEFNAVYTFGYNKYGQLGDNSILDKHEAIKGKNTNDKFNPSNGPKIEIAKIYAGYDTTFIFTKKGDIYGYGLNTNGQLGDGTGVSTIKGEKIKSDGDLNKTIPLDLYVGFEHAMVRTASAMSSSINVAILFITILMFF